MARAPRWSALPAVTAVRSRAARPPFAPQSVRSARDGHDGARSRTRRSTAMIDPAFPKGALQLLEGAVPDRPERRGDSHADRRVPGVPVADEPHHHRALPRRGEPRAGVGDGVHDARHGLQRGHRRRSGWTRGRRNGASRGRARRSRRCTPYLAATRYVNYLEDEAADPAAVAYGPNLRRLRAIKTKYDPENFFRQNVNILPM